MLTGPEVKSCRLGHVELAGAYLSFQGGKPQLKHLKITPYAFAASVEQVPERDRPLLLSKTQSAKLQETISQKGISVIPLEVQAGKYIKIVLGIGRGRKTVDKRARIKERETEKRLKKGEDM